MAELLYWIYLDCKGVPNKLATECVWLITRWLKKNANILLSLNVSYSEKCKG